MTTSKDIDPELYKLTALCSQIALTCAALNTKLTQGPAAGLCDKRLAYQSAVRLADTGEAFNHRALYHRLYHITVAGKTDRRTAFDGGAAQHAAQAYHSLLSKAGGGAPSQTRRQSQVGYGPSPALEAVLAYRHASVDGPLTASRAAMNALAVYDWLPSPTPPIAWRASLRAIQAKSLAAALRSLSEALTDAVETVDAVERYLGAAEAVTQGFRTGSAVRTLLPVLAREPVVTQGVVLQMGLMSDVSFQNGVKELEALGVCLELTKRKRHRCWTALGRGLIPSFEGLALPALLVANKGRKERSLAIVTQENLGFDRFGNLEKALDAISKLVDG